MIYPLEYTPKRPKPKYIEIDIGKPLKYEIGEVVDEKKGVFQCFKIFKDFEEAINFFPPINGCKYWLLREVKVGTARVGSDGTVYPVIRMERMYNWDGSKWIMYEKFRETLGIY